VQWLIQYPTSFSISHGFMECMKQKWPCQLHKTVTYMNILVFWDITSHWPVHTYMGSKPRRFDICQHYCDNLKSQTIIYIPPLTKTACNKQLSPSHAEDQNYTFPYNVGIYLPTHRYQDRSPDNHGITFLKTVLYTVFALRTSNTTRRSNSTL